jgi:hypothetical protein
VSKPTPLRLLYGPDRLPLEENADATAARWDYRPFHGIVSLGLRLHPACTPERWRAAAPLLDTAPRTEALARAARDCGVLSFDESLAAAAHAACEYGEDASVVELWNLKEGHTTSVWRATFASDYGATAAGLARLGQRALRRRTCRCPRGRQHSRPWRRR